MLIVILILYDTILTNIILYCVMLYYILLYSTGPCREACSFWQGGDFMKHDEPQGKQVFYKMDDRLQDGKWPLRF